MSALVLGFILLTSGLWMQTTAEFMIGDCNLTYFISYGQRCQRQMITNLATNPSTNCSAEYQDEKECLRDHIAVCLGREYPGHINLVANLLLYQLYHCGNVEYKHNSMYGIVLDSMQCQREAFTGTEICWRYFRERFNANRTDPMLCREYAIAKKCMTEKAKANCRICDRLRRDTYNPFCPNNTDPGLQVNACRDLLMPLSCSRLRTYKMALDCEHKFVTSFMGNTRPDCRHFKTAVTCSNDVQATFCKVEKEVTSMTDNTYNSFCEFKSENIVSGAQFVSTQAIIFVIAFGLTL